VDRSALIPISAIDLDRIDHRRFLFKCDHP
jgi:hypothetical protein